MQRSCPTATIGYMIWLGVAAGLLIPFFMSFHGLVDWSGNLIGRDFVNMWTGAHAVVRGAIDRLFELNSYQAFQAEVFGFRILPHNWSYPPHLLPFLVPLALLPYAAALIVWSAVGLALYLFACARGASRLEVIALALAPASVINLLTGQNGFFTAALLWSGFVLLDRRPIVAGIAFGFLSLKPQVALLLPLILLLDRRWVTIAAAAATAACLIAFAALAFGVEPFIAFVTKAMPYQAALFAGSPYELFGTRMIPTAFMNARLAGADITTAWMLQVPVSLFGIALVVWTARRTDEPLLRYAGLVTGTFLASPYLLVYDMTMFGPVILGLWPRVKDRLPAQALIGALWSLPAVGLVLAMAGIPISALVIVAFGGWLATEVARYSGALVSKPA
jgi:hypothetical protein